MKFIAVASTNFFAIYSDGRDTVWSYNNLEAILQIITITFNRYGREIYQIGASDEERVEFYIKTKLATSEYC